MADSAPEIAEAERREAIASLEKKANLLAESIRTSKHFIVFTGAGIATSAGVADFRGPNGVWTLRKQKRMHDLKSVDTEKAVPTSTHMALVELQNHGMLKYLVSQNCDGLHRKSGILPDKISELHGNSNRESCATCGKEYLRDFHAVAAYEKTVTDHRTGRKCARPDCDGVLVDSIVNFGEQLPVQAEKRARAEARKADVCLVLGSSLTVTPANEIPEIVAKKGKKSKLVICNLQSTPLDDEAGLRIFHETDVLVRSVMEKLGLQIPAFALRRRLLVKMDKVGEDRHQLLLEGVDVDGTPETFLRSARLDFNRRTLKAEPFSFDLRGTLEAGTTLKLELEFMGYYNEPKLEFLCQHDGSESRSKLYLLSFDPSNGTWTVSSEDQVPETEDDSNAGIREHGKSFEPEESSTLSYMDIEEMPNDVKAAGSSRVRPIVLDE